METVEKSTNMGRTSIQVTDELADELHARKNRGDSYEDVVWRLIDVPGEYRIDCNECGFDGGSYDYMEGDAPAYCPRCGTAVEESEKVVVAPGPDEPTSLSWRHDQ
jgi:hypothetical protein